MSDMCLMVKVNRGSRATLLHDSGRIRRGAAFPSQRAHSRDGLWPPEPMPDETKGRAGLSPPRAHSLQEELATFPLSEALNVSS